MKTAMQELWEYIEANYNEENFNIFDAKTKSLELEKKQIIEALNQFSNETLSDEFCDKYYINIK